MRKARGSLASVDKSVGAALAFRRHASILKEWERAVDRLGADPAGAITASRTLMETTCKFALEQLGVAYDKNTDLPKLYSLACKALGMAAGDQPDQLFRSMFGAAHTVVQTVGELRNRLGDAHGKGQETRAPSFAQAELAVNLAGSVTVFLMRALESHLAATKRLTAGGEAVLKFDRATVWRLVDHAKNSPEHSKSWGQRKPKPALWLVGDSGVYLMSNGQPQISHDGLVPRDGSPTKIPYLTAHAEGCDYGDRVDDWWPIHNAIDGGNDFVRVIPLNVIEDALLLADSEIVILAGRTGFTILGDSEFDLENPS